MQCVKTIHISTLVVMCGLRAGSPAQTLMYTCVCMTHTFNREGRLPTPGSCVTAPCAFPSMSNPSQAGSIYM